MINMNKHYDFCIIDMQNKLMTLYNSNKIMNVDMSSDNIITLGNVDIEFNDGFYLSGNPIKKDYAYEETPVKDISYPVLDIYTHKSYVNPWPFRKKNEVPIDVVKGDYVYIENDTNERLYIPFDFIIRIIS